MQPLLSIVVPVYNTAHLLCRCLDSIVSSNGYSSDKVQIVVVSDASPDNCDSIVDRYLQKYPAIIYVRREANGGVSAARNSGLKVCSGLYYTYVDSDDTVTCEYIKTILNVIVDISPDMIAYRYRECTEGDEIKSFGGDGVVRIFNDGCAASEFQNMFHTFALCLRFNAVYKRSVIKGITYDIRYKLAEDALFAFKSYLRSKSFCVIDEAIYNYYQYNKSATHHITAEMLIGLFEIHDFIRKEVCKQPYYSSVAHILFLFFCSNYLGWINNDVYRNRNTNVINKYIESFCDILEMELQVGYITRIETQFARRCIKHRYGIALLRKWYMARRILWRLRRLVKRT